MAQSADYRWLVEQRARIQSTLLELYECSASPLVSGSSLEPNWAWAWGFMVGTGFSLWRAVFLAETAESERDKWEDIHKNATLFLGEVIKTNTITFTQDQSMRVWTCRYYLHNAYCKLAEALDRLSKDQSTRFQLARESIRIFREQNDSGFSGASRRELWMKAHNALEALVEVLRERARSTR